MDEIIATFIRHVESLSAITAVFVFVVYLAIDTLYARYTIAVTQLESHRAASSAAIIYFLLAVGVLNYTDNPLYILPMVVGSWCGTFFTVEYEKGSTRKKHA